MLFSPSTLIVWLKHSCKRGNLTSTWNLRGNILLFHVEHLWVGWKWAQVQLSNSRLRFSLPWEGGDILTVALKILDVLIFPTIFHFHSMCSFPPFFLFPLHIAWCSVFSSGSDLSCMHIPFQEHSIRETGKQCSKWFFFLLNKLSADVMHW